MAKITITGLRKLQTSSLQEYDRVERRLTEETHTFESDVPADWLDLEPSQIPTRLLFYGYNSPTKLESPNASVQVKVVDKTSESCYDAATEGGLCIREDETFASWWTKMNGGHKDSEVKLNPESVSVYGTTTTFKRTLRVPDAGQSSRLPPSMGNFPLVPVKDHSENLPDVVNARGGYMIPMFQREALWLRLQHQPTACNAMKVSVGGINALTGSLKGEVSKPGVQDYMCKSQPWLDGTVKDEGKVKQFVAMPVGQGYTIEEQLTGKNTEATMQLDIFPAFRRDIEVKVNGEITKNLLLTPSKAGARAGETISIRPRTFTGGYTLACLLKLHGNLSLAAIYENPVPKGLYQGLSRLGSVSQESACFGGIDAIVTRGYSMPAPAAMAKKAAVMGIGAGGSIDQQIDKDPQDPEIYDFDAGKRIYIHFINAGAWNFNIICARLDAGSFCSHFCALTGQMWLLERKPGSSLAQITTMYAEHLLIALNGLACRDVTGLKAPITPVDRKAYKDNSIPWFDFYNEPEPANKLGDGFKEVRSVNDIDAEDRKEWSERDERIANGEKPGEEDEALFKDRWEKDNEGKIVDINASRVSTMKTKSQFSVPPSCLRRLHKKPLHPSKERSSNWTFDADNVSKLSK